MKILVATDFSANANHATEYAAVIANTSHGQLILLHIVTTDITSPGIRGVAGDEIISKMNDGIEQLKKTVAFLSTKYSNARINYILHEGDCPDAIIQKGEEENVDLIVMGTLGASGLKKVFYGSNTVAVIQQAKRPVLAVPTSSEIKVPEKIIFATDYYFSDLIVVKTLSRFAEFCDAEVLIIHIIESEKNETEEKELLNNFKLMVERETPYPKFYYTLFHNQNQKEGMEKYMNSINGDVLAVSTRVRGAFEKLVQKSITESLVKDPQYPVLVFHVDKNIEGPEF